jgi:RNA recognition motif-containing protein
MEVSKKLSVRNLSLSTTDEDLNNLFSQVGPVLSVLLPRDVDTGHHRGIGFVEMETEAAAHAAIAQFNDAEFMGRSLIVVEAQPQGDGADIRKGRHRKPGQPAPSQPGGTGFGG